MFIDKEIIRKRFAKSWQTYNQHASVQLEICQKLTGSLQDKRLSNFESILEVGCGSGLLTRELLKQTKIRHYYANDLTGEQKTGITQIFRQFRFSNWSFLEGDAEVIDFPQQLDGVISTSTVQWFNDLPAFIPKVHQVLNTKGIFAFSTFGPGNFSEIKSTCQQGLSYYSTDEIQEMLAKYFDVELIHDEKTRLHFNSPIEILHHIKNTGVNAVANASTWNRRKLQEFEQNYPVSDKNDFVLTYHPIIILAKKRHE
jgi:malonyl-CoA O-methyltransferase